MPIQPTLTRGSLSEAAQLRRQAGDLLARLIDDRESSEQRLAAAGKRDPIKTVTGVTALERAILATREMIADMDMLLAELDCGIQNEHSQPPLANATPLTRPLASTIRPRAGGMLHGQRPVAATV